MQRIKLTVAQALIKFLSAQYVQFDGKENKFVRGVMGIFGHGNVVGLGQALEEYKSEIQYIQGKNEQDIAHAGMAYAKQMNRLEIFACTASIGPGSTNMLTTAANATVNHIPLLLLPSDAYADRQPDPVLQQIENSADSTITVNDAFKPVSRYWDRISRPDQLMKACLNAMRVLTDPAETGAVTLALPQDVQGESYDYPVDFFKKRVWYIDRISPSQNEVERASALVSSSKKPLLIIGGGARYSAAGEVILQLAENFNIPFAETQAGKSEIPNSFSHPLCLGCIGACGTLSANMIAKQADLVIAVGTKLNDFVTSSKSAFQLNTPILSINVSRMDSYKMDSLSMHCDAKMGLLELAKELRKKNYKSSYGDEIHNARLQWKEELARLSKENFPNGLSQRNIILLLNNLLKESDIVVSASGSIPSDLARLWQPKDRYTYHLEYGYSCMGYEIPAALGVKVAQPEKEVFALLGDGAFLMSHSELVTTLQEQKKITILLFDNHGHQCIHNLQRSQGIDSFATEFCFREERSMELKGSYLNIDYAGVAKAYGCNAYTVHAIDELVTAIEEARESKVSVLIDIKVLPGTMTDGYESFWRVGTATVSGNKKVELAGNKMQSIVKELRPY